MKYICILVGIIVGLYVSFSNKRNVKLIVSNTPLIIKDFSGVNVKLLSKVKDSNKYYLDLRIDNKVYRIMSDKQYKIKRIAIKLGVEYFENCKLENEVK